jgi:hypothetical protein
MNMIKPDADGTVIHEAGHAALHIALGLGP